MSGTPSPARLHTKSSDISEFFRVGGHSSRPRAGDAPKSGPSSTASSSPAYLSEPESSSSPRRRSMIPFLGRQRKKSAHADIANVAAVAAAAHVNRQSEGEPRYSNVSKASRRTLPLPEVPLLLHRHETPERSSVASSSSPPSLGSKIAAHFVPSRQRLISLSPRKPSPYNETPPSSGGLAPPASSSRGTSMDSTSSDNRSSTPRPTITVSLSPDNLDGYEGLFTLPTSETSKSPSPNAELRLRSDDRIYTGSPVSDRSPSRSRISRVARKYVGSAMKQSDVDSTDAEDSEAVMSDTPKSSPPMHTPIVEKRRTLATTMPYTFAEKAPRSIMKSSVIALPPALPLPPPPPSDPPSPTLLGTPPSSSEARSLRRPRAHTLSSTPIPLPFKPPTSPIATVPSRRLSKSEKIPIPLNGPAPAAGKDAFDMATASAEELRQALVRRNQQFDELASYLLKITEAHVAEKHALLKKIGALEQDATRKDNEIKGLTWLVTNNRPGSSDTIKSTASTIKPTRSSSADDFGAQSHQASGAEDSHSGSESLQGSSTADSSSERRSSKSKRHPNPNNSFYRMSATETASSSSSTTSLLTSVTTTPSTPATTVSSLSSIPESRDPIVAAAILASEKQRAKQERRASKTVDRHASASATSGVSASAAYAANLKRGRPPSIAQVLASSPKMDHVRDRPRLYTSGSASS
ncbi:unnamed protein product [Mycena citricolor]|uniref:Uncharacterized protein n=1 Tax=Mycena citricolor TaxID=2018698 RepID=A0AAD2HIZ1_9AGAR|nr:unnamed protein product [Mycena citricolor]